MTSGEEAQANPVEMVFELKNGVKIQGTITSIDDQMNFQLSETKCLNSDVFQCCGDSIFVRGNVIRYIHLPAKEVDTEPLTQACRKFN